MIANDMRYYDYYIYGEANEYGQPILPDEVQGQVKMAIYNSSKSVTGDITYSGGDYIGLTRALVTDRMVIQYGDIKLKVLYCVVSARHLTQVMMTKVNS